MPTAAPLDDHHRDHDHRDHDHRDHDQELRVKLQEQIGDDVRLGEVAASTGAEVFFRAHDVATGRDMLLKVLALEHAPASEACRRLAREAAITARLHHINVAPVGLVEQRGSVAFYAIGVADAVPLESLLRGESPLAFGQCLSILHDVAAALDHARGQGIIHGCLTPNAIFITGTGRALVAGFSGDENSGADETACWSPAYMAPEQWQHESKADASTDRYALGIIAYELLTGRRRPVSLSVPGVITVSPLNISADVPLRAGVDLGANGAILRALSKHLDQRPRSAQEFVDALVGDPRAGVPSLATQRPRVALPRRRHALRTPTLAILGLCLVGAVATSSTDLLSRLGIPSASSPWFPDLLSPRGSVREVHVSSADDGTTRTLRAPAIVRDGPDPEAREPSAAASPVDGAGDVVSDGAVDTVSAPGGALGSATSAGAIRVTLRGGSALVFIDGVSRGRTPFIGRVSPGSHIVSLRGPGSYVPAARSVSVIAADTVIASFSTVAPPRPR